MSTAKIVWCDDTNYYGELIWAGDIEGEPAFTIVDRDDIDGQLTLTTSYPRPPRRALVRDVPEGQALAARWLAEERG